MNKLLSIVLPVYNMEDFLIRCLESLTAIPEFHHQSIEIIIVNDGSTDNSSSIIDYYQCYFDFIFVVEQQNAGLGQSRNNGLKLAKGKYVWFVDSDDFIDSNSINLIIDELKVDPDILTLDFKCADENSNSIDWLDFHLSPVGETIDANEFYNINYKYSYIWLYIFKRSILVDNKILFQKRINMQDSEIIPRIMSHAKTVKVTDILSYFYVKRSSSFINNPNPKVRFTYFKSIITVYDLLSKYMVQTDNIGIHKGLEKKLKDIEKILFLSFLYDPLTKKDSLEAVCLMRGINVFPFDSLNNNNNLKNKLLNHCVNFSPVLFKWIFTNIRLIKRKLNA